MKPELIVKYADILHAYHSITFEYKDVIYRIWNSDDGYQIDMLMLSDETTEYGQSIWITEDGGICTGTAKDAIKFML